MSRSAVSYDVYAEEVGTETQGTITAELDGEIVGDLDFVDYDGTTQITRVAVEPDYQRQGIATGMLAELRAFFPASVPAQFLMNMDARALHRAVFDDFKTPTE